MGNTHATLFRESTIPGLSTIFSSRSYARKMILLTVFSVLVFFTLKDLTSIVTDYFTFPITVSVLVTESRVLPFPGVTICNLNPVHRGRFCSKEIEKPDNIRRILCASLMDLFEVCKITEALEQLVDDGRKICEGGKSRRGGGGSLGGTTDDGGRRIKRPRRPEISPSTDKPSQTNSDGQQIPQPGRPRGRGRSRRPRMRRPQVTAPTEQISSATTFRPKTGGGRKSSGNITIPDLPGMKIPPLGPSSPNLGAEVAGGVVDIVPDLNPLTRRIIKSRVKNVVKNMTPNTAAISKFLPILQSSLPIGGPIGGDHDGSIRSCHSCQFKMMMEEVDKPSMAPAVVQEQPSIEDDPIDPKAEGEEEEDDYSQEEDYDEDDEGIKEEYDQSFERTKRAFSSVLSSFALSGGAPKCPFQSNLRQKREAGEIKFNLKTLMSTFKQIQSGNLSGGLLQPLTESGGLLETIVLQVAQFYGINANSTRELLPAMFLRAFTQVTGCSVGQASSDGGETPKVSPVNQALDNLTTIFQRSGCIWKAPKLVKLFQSTSERLINQLTSCTGPWVNELLGFNASSEAAQEGQTPWFLLLELLENWSADLSRTDPEKAMKIGHQSKDIIRDCIFAGKKCNIQRDFRTTFYSQHGNCFTYLMESGEALKESMSGFTGPKFGLELLFNLEKDQYMPTSREAGVKIIVHDRNQKADPDQDAINISPGVVTYVGVQMMNISRLPAPYPDECMDDWPDGNEEAIEYRKWASSLNHESYTIQVCLKICLQLYTIKMCKCWTSSALWPPYPDIPECATKSKDAEECVDIVRHLYYEEKIKCHCPPRCTDRIYERFLSTGQETRQCSAIQSETSQVSSEDGPEKSSADDKENSAKVIVYFHSLTFREINQQKKYTMEGLLGAIGGILGVYLGISFFAIFEFFEVLFRGVFGVGLGGGGSRVGSRERLRTPDYRGGKSRRHDDRDRRRDDRRRR